MSEPTLYQINRHLLNGDNELLAKELQASLDHLSSYGVLGRVVRCEHRNIDSHIVEGPINTDYDSWCPGAGIGDNDG